MLGAFTSMATKNLDTWVDIGDTLDLKIQALKKHVSQGDTHDVENWIHVGRGRGKDKGIKYSESTA